MTLASGPSSSHLTVSIFSEVALLVVTTSAWASPWNVLLNSLHLFFRKFIHVICTCIITIRIYHFLQQYISIFNYSISKAEIWFNSIHSIFIKLHIMSQVVDTILKTVSHQSFNHINNLWTYISQPQFYCLQSQVLYSYDFPLGFTLLYD